MENSALEVLSQQHRQDLQQCGRIMQEIQEQTDKKTVRDDILRFWNNGLQKHVQSEDTLLVPFLLRHRFNTGYVEMLKRENDTIRLLAQRIPVHEDGSYLYRAFIRLVEQHIEFEDRVIFKKMQEEISEVDLKSLNMQISKFAN